MRMRRMVVACGAVVSVLVMSFSPLAYAQQSSSSNYQVNEVFMGSGGELNACSPAYCAKQSAGEVAAGNTASNAFKAVGGFNTDRAPYIAFSVAGGSTDLGTLSTAATAYTTGTFAIKTYLAHGYEITLAANPPTSNGVQHTMAAPSSPTAPAIGTEQFGMNLVANTSPASVGAGPVQVPDNTFSFGEVAPGYDQTNLFKYVKGDTIAQSSRSSGQTNFTMTFIYNISSVTPNGDYAFNGIFVATSTY